MEIKKVLTMLFALPFLALAGAADLHAGMSAPPPGSGEETIQGSVTVCFTPGTMTPEPCSHNRVTSVVVSFLEVGQATWDSKGNACVSGVETISVPGTSVNMTRQVNLVGKLSNYDRAAQSGDGTGTAYNGGKCVGAAFDDSGATVRSTATFHFVISQNGKRLDSVLTSVSVVGEEVGAFSLSATGFKQ